MVIFFFPLLLLQSKEEGSIPVYVLIGKNSEKISDRTLSDLPRGMYECAEGSAAAGGKDGMGTTLYPSLYGDRACVFVSWNRL